MKKFSALSVFAMLSVLLCGCSKQETKKVQAYLNDRFHEEFEIIDTDKDELYDGKTYSYSVFCRSTAHPEYRFEVTTDEGGRRMHEYWDSYAASILNARAAQKLDDLLLADFETFFVRVDVPVNRGYYLNEMESITYEQYFRDLRPDYPEQPADVLWTYYTIYVQEESYVEKDYEAEFDKLFVALREMCDTLQTNGVLRINIFPEPLYARSVEWYSQYPSSYAMPSTSFSYDGEKLVADIEVISQVIACDHTTRESVQCLLLDQPMTRETYAAERIGKLEDQ
jgi:hypothetical protein